MLSKNILTIFLLLGLCSSGFLGVCSSVDELSGQQLLEKTSEKAPDSPKVVLIASALASRISLSIAQAIDNKFPNQFDEEELSVLDDQIEESLALEESKRSLDMSSLRRAVKKAVCFVLDNTSLEFDQEDMPRLLNELFEESIILL